jgi:MFS transporter, FLVCR family, MFS-domain-containing protein 7
MQATVICLPAPFLPKQPPTPPSASSSLPKTSLSQSVPLLIRSPSFWLVFLPYTVYVGLFNALSSLLNQILEPYGFSETDAGITGALLIVVGLVFAAITSPLSDRYHTHLTPIKILVPILAIAYLAFTFAPATRNVAAPYAISAVIGAASFALVPIALEYLVEVNWPASPEVSSVFCWAGGQLLGAILIIGMGELKGAAGEPAGSMKRALILQAVIACVVVPAPLCLGVKSLGLGQGNIKGRLDVDEQHNDRENENTTTHTER